MLSPSSPNSRSMDKYEKLSVIGEGSYGVVLKCRRRDTGQLVAIKKFLETEDDAAVRKMALREIRMLKKLRHPHLVNMIEVFRRKRRFYLVFEYLDHTLLDELEASSGGLGEDNAKKHMYQLLKGIDYCHRNAIIHRDVKPENVLVSNAGVVKLCDLGFARALAAPGEPYTEYVATRWYRAPELLVADHRYGPEVDIWAMGCIFAEMLTGDPLFPGDSDIDQLALIIKTVGKLAPRHQQVVARLSGVAAAAAAPRAALPGAGAARDLLAACLRTEPRARPYAHLLLKHKYFTADGFMESFNAELRLKLGKEMEEQIPSPKQGSAQVVTNGKSQWTLNIVPEQLSQRHSTTESLIDYNYLQGAEKAENKCLPICDPICDIKDCNVLRSSASLPPAPRPSNPKSLAKAINNSFQTFHVPTNTYPRTPYIKKVNNKLVIDEDMVRGKTQSKKVSKKPNAQLSLPYVPGAINNPIKQFKKTGCQQIPNKQDNWSRMHPANIKVPTNLPYIYFTADGFMESFNAELRLKLGKEMEEQIPSPKQGSAQVVTNGKSQWTLNIVPEQLSQRHSTTESLIDYNYLQGAEKAENKCLPICDPICDIKDCNVLRSSASLPPAPRPSNPKSLAKAINNSFQTFHVPTNTYPRTPYIKKVNNKLVIDEDMVRGKTQSKKVSKKPNAQLSLPYVPGAINNPIKQFKKTGCQQIPNKQDNWSRMHPANIKVPTNLPYM